ncbi:regulator of RNase E activity RraA [Cytobacillus firmus]|uniref:Putative 4-hydroxy-4-methyl-2-oxoglutarate aldolase n=2 Tax=Cytobacillus TaxID=2675230 RepID=A0A366JAP9_CYTFI|nr:MULTISPECIES: RraA family protein [Cytobacillus]RBP84033.1 regulator of RNase E activity RraA [Cytobacillus firmus]TDX34339.1 regulator of RNase E activity RraA [Cytobacillus oceanisediminis]
MSLIIDQFRSIPTTCISDALDGLNNLHPSIKPLSKEYVLCGRAFTVKMPVGDNLAVLKAIRTANPGDILVIDAKGDEYRAIAGDFIIGMAKTLEIGGIVVDGVIRDLKGIQELNFPLFCKGTTVAASGKAGVGELNVPISCGGISVKPGDIIVGDTDGVVVVPKETEEVILKKAQDKLMQDQIRADTISGKRLEIIKYLDSMIYK